MSSLIRLIQIDEFPRIDRMELVCSLNINWSKESIKKLQSLVLVLIVVLIVLVDFS